MSTFALPGGRGPVCPDLPPTLLPHAIAASAPPRDRLRSLLMAGGVYVLLGGTGLLLARSRVVPRMPPGVIEPPIVLTEVDPRPAAPRPPAPTPAPRTASTAAGPAIPPATAGPLATPAPLPVDPSGPVPTYPTEDHHGDRIAGRGAGPAGPGLPGPTTGDGPASVQNLDVSQVRILHQVTPLYPALARITRVQGPVVLLMTIDESGVPTEVQVLEGHPVFREEAVRAARQWRFEPARMGGQPVRARFRLTLNFRLQ